MMYILYSSPNLADGRVTIMADGEVTQRRLIDQLFWISWRAVNTIICEKNAYSKKEKKNQNICSHLCLQLIGDHRIHCVLFHSTTKGKEYRTRRTKSFLWWFIKSNFHRESGGGRAKGNVYQRR